VSQFEKDNMEISRDKAIAMKTGKTVTQVREERENAAKAANYVPHASDSQELVTKNTSKDIDFRAFVQDDQKC
jgi:hypothetical protein